MDYEKIVDKLSDKNKDNFRRLCMRVDTSMTLNDVLLSKANKEKIDEFITERTNRKKFMDIGLEPVNRILMYGASGTGKTFLTKALSNYFDLPMLYVDISNALTMGNAAKSLEEVFDIAHELGEAIIFLDECDSICWAREDRENNDSAAIRRANNTLFQLLDQMSTDCIFVSATNLYENLDVAFVRRFNVKMKFLRPDITDFTSVMCKFLNHEVFIINRDMNPELKAIIDYQAKEYNRISYYQIEDWVHRAEKAAALNNEKVIKESDVYNYLMLELRIEVKQDKEGKYYLHKYGVDKR